MRRFAAADGQQRSQPLWMRWIASALEVAVAVAVATGAVAALQSTAPAAGLGIVYLLAVLTVAISRGEVAALATSVLSVLTLNYLFIAPRHRLVIAHSQDVVELGVLLIAAVVVGRLAAIARQRAAESESRATLAMRHEREAALLAETATAILARAGLEAQLESVANQVAAASGASTVRAVLDPESTPQAGETAFGLPSRYGTAWLYVADDVPYDRGLITRLSGPLGSLIDVAVERAKVADRAAETEAARRTDMARTAILHAISHDLRSPITAITTAGAALGTRGVTEPERLELVEAVQAESARLAKMVDDLLDLSKIEAGAVAPRSDWCDLHDVVVSAARRFDREHVIERKLPADLPLVRADASQLERVFSNLIENAIKFSPPGSSVHITGGASPAWVTVRITDYGRGVPREQRRHIFEPFFRGRGGGSSGSGLGLAICRGFVDANGGRITLQTGTGRGTSFAVSFPAVPQPSSEFEPRTPLGSAHGER